ncbi:MAG: ParB/RepB/Spo0J family partition protein [Maritimibacter sp.]
MTNQKPNRGLGRGLSALMADVSPEPKETQSDSSSTRRPELIVSVEKIHPNPEQPRRRFTRDQLADLAASIKEKGIIQPLILRPDPEKQGEYQIVAGERRWRAAQLAQLHEVPAVVRDYDDTEALEVAIIENIQRADLNPVEEAAGYRDLMKKFGHTQEQLAEALGKSRSHIANMLRLLSLPEDIQVHLIAGDISTGHARALITSENPSALAKQVIAAGLSVRETERLAKKPSAGEAKSVSNTRQKPSKDADTLALEGDLSATIGMNVSINHGSGEDGTLTIKYPSLEALDDLCRRLGGDV